jgi:hypothetical protein
MAEKTEHERKIKSDLEGPHGAYHGMKGPDGAEKLPIKHYPETTKMATEGKHVTIEGPCQEKSGYHK